VKLIMRYPYCLSGLRPQGEGYPAPQEMERYPMSFFANPF
jgi:hypothetical protein